MARLFDDGNNDYLTVAASPADVPLTMACWYQYDADIGGIVCMGVADTDAQEEHLLYLDTASQNVFAWSNDGGSGAQSGKTHTSIDTWEHAAGVWAATNSRKAYLNGSVGAENTTNLTPVNLDNVAIGSRNYNSGQSLFFSGFIAESAIWNVALTDAEITILAAGYSPLFVRPQNLVFYAPLIRGLNDKVGGLVLTASGTTVSAHPPIIYPANVRVGAPVVEGGGVTHELAGLIAGISSVTGNLVLQSALSGIVNGVSSVTGALNMNAALSGAVAGTSSVTGHLSALVSLAAIVNGISSVTGMLGLTKSISGVVAAVSSVTGTLQTVINLSGIVNAVSSVTGNIQRVRGLVGTVNGVSGVIGNLTRYRGVAGLVTALSTVSGTLTTGDTIWVSLDGILYMAE